MPKKPPEINRNRNPVLTKSRTEVSGVLQARIKLGNEILLKEIKSDSDLDQIYKPIRQAWHCDDNRYPIWRICINENFDEWNVVFIPN